MGKPTAELDLRVDVVRALLESQHPDLATEPILEIASGWDNVTFRLGDNLAVRLPRRAAAAELIAHEQRWLPLLQPKLPVPVPVPVRLGGPQGVYPWSWSVVRWIHGDTVDRSPLGADGATTLANFFNALHVTAPPEAPHNEYRGVPLQDRRETFLRCVSSFLRGGRLLDDRLLGLWDAASTAPMDTAPTWIHGDLHARNVLAIDGRISGVIDWGDMAVGDRATDLAATWMLLPRKESRETVLRICKSVSDHTWCRARGWALLLSLVVLESADPVHADAAELTLSRLTDGP